MPREIEVKLIENALFNRTLPKRYESLAALFHEDPAPARGQFRLKEKNPGDDGSVCGAIAMMLRQSLGRERGHALRLVEFECDDPHVTRDQVASRLADLPLRVDVKDGYRLKLDAKNDTARTRSVMSGEFAKPERWKTMPFPGNAALINIDPGCFLRLEAEIEQVPTPTSGQTPMRGGQPVSNPGGVLAIRARAVPCDQGGESALTAEPSEFLLAFDTTGNIMPLALLQRALDSALNSLRTLDVGKVTAETGENMFQLGADASLAPGAAKVLARLCFLADPEIEFVAAHVDSVSRIQLVRMRESQGAAAVVQRLEAAKKELTATLEDLLRKLVNLE